jgi:diketogulonate reductase-like aldo/keto reductase
MITRRQFLKTAILAGLLPVNSNLIANTSDILTRVIPKSGEAIPAIGMGTWQTFHLPNLKEKDIQKRVEVLKTFFAAGGSVIDSSPMYMNAQQVLGLCFDQISDEIISQLFSATKVWSVSETIGLEQISKAETLWREKQFDLMQVHNLLRWKPHLKNLQRLKQEKKIRYIGITTSHQRRHEEFSDLMRNEKIDFVQFSYSIENRKAEKKLLPLAQDKNLAVMINRPFKTGRLLNKLEGKPLPDWASEISVTAWSQFLLKFIISHPAVTVVIPATRNVAHMQENMQALKGSMPDSKMREEMIRYYKSVTT